MNKGLLAGLGAMAGLAVASIAFYARGQEKWLVEFNESPILRAKRDVLLYKRLGSSELLNNLHEKVREVKNRPNLPKAKRDEYLLEMYQEIQRFLKAKDEIDEICKLKRNPSKLIENLTRKRNEVAHDTSVDFDVQRYSLDLIDDKLTKLFWTSYFDRRKECKEEYQEFVNQYKY